jgi:hypothetical protein
MKLKFTSLAGDTKFPTKEGNANEKSYKEVPIEHAK